MSRRLPVAEVKVHSDREKDAIPPLCERIRKRVDQTVRAGIGSLDLTLSLKNGSERKAHPVSDVVRTPHREVELVTQAVPFPLFTTRITELNWAPIEASSF